MKRIAFILCMALVAVCWPMPTKAIGADAVRTTKTTKKKTANRKKTSARLLATFTVDGNKFQLLSGGKIKCLTDPNWHGSYEKDHGPMGFSRYSPEADWYIISLNYSGADGEYIYLIFNDTDYADKIYDLAAGSVGFTIEINPIYFQATIIADDEPDVKETKEFSELKVAGKVNWVKK